MTELSLIIQGSGLSSMFFTKKRQKEVDKVTQILEERHLRQITKIEQTETKVRHVTEAIAAATGALKR